MTARSVFPRILALLLAQRLGKRPVLVLSGKSDDRVPWDYVQGYAERFAKAGMTVTTEGYDGDDHFLLFRRRPELTDRLARWIGDRRLPARAGQRTGE